VSAVKVHEDAEILHLAIGDDTIEATPEHPFWTIERGWVTAGSLWPGAHVRRADGGAEVVRYLAPESRRQAMYDLTVDGAHTFFVGQRQLLAHNAGKCKIGATGALGEARLAQLGGRAQEFFRTSVGRRFVDRYLPWSRIANESKVGYAALESFIRRQVQADAELIATGQVSEAVWHFFTSPVTNAGGPSANLLGYLWDHGISVMIY